MKRIFEIEYEDDCGPLWINKSSLLLCLTNTCKNSKFTVRDLTGDECDPSPETAGPVNPSKDERRRESIINAVAQAWCTAANEHKVMDPVLAQTIIDNIIAIIDN